MHANFRELSTTATFNSSTLAPQGLTQTYTDDEVQQLRNAGINAITQRKDGALMIGPGGGVNLGQKKWQKSAKIANSNIDLPKVLKAAEDMVKRRAVKAGIALDQEVHLVEENGQLIVKDASGAFQVNLSQIIRPLR